MKVAADLGDVGSLVSAVLALVAVIVALIANRHSLRSADAAHVSALAAQRAADAADRSAAAEELVARIEADRHQQEADEREQARLAAERSERAAVVKLRTEHVRVSSSPYPGDGIGYVLIVSNAGRWKADHLSIGNFACNGVGDHDWPATADSAALNPRESLLPNRELEIPLRSSGDRNQWDVYECVVSWEDGNGPHQERLQIERRW